MCSSLNGRIRDCRVKEKHTRKEHVNQWRSRRRDDQHQVLRWVSAVSNFICNEDALTDPRLDSRSLPVCICLLEAHVLKQSCKLEKTERYT